MPRGGLPAWSPEDEALLVAWYAERRGRPLDLDELAVRLGRLKSSICRKARRLGLTDHRRTRVEKIDGRFPSDVPKFRSDDERRAHLSACRKRWLAEHDHPRGALGLKHSEETRRKVGEASRRHWETITPGQREERRLRRNATVLERYGTTNPAMLGVEEPYSRAHGGKRDDLGGRYFRSAWEANYCRYLAWLQAQGEILAWEYEADTFVFHGETRGAIAYTPDFKVTERDGSIAYHEVKGWMDGPSKTRLRRMAKHYPDVRIVVIGEAEYKAVAKWRALIPGWELPGDAPRRGQRR